MTFQPSLTSLPNRSRSVADADPRSLQRAIDGPQLRAQLVRLHGVDEFVSLPGGGALLFAGLRRESEGENDLIRAHVGSGREFARSRKVRERPGGTDASKVLRYDELHEAAEH